MTPVTDPAEAATLGLAAKVGLVACGGAVGAALRFAAVEGLAEVFGRHSVPWPTAAVNISGSLLLGVLIGATAVARSDAGAPDASQHDIWRLLLAVGVLGSFTTFSTFSHENWELWRAGRAAAAAGHAALTVLLCLGAAAVGTLAAERIGALFLAPK